MRNNKTKTIAYVGISAALALILSFFKIFRMPQGGQVSLEMVPLIILALTCGFYPALIGGVLFGIFHFFQEPVILHPVQALLDYPLAFGVLAFAALFADKKNPFKIYFGITLAVFLRFVFHCVSGYVFFKAYAPANSVLWIYVAAYNASYLVPALIVLYLIVPLIYNRLKSN